MTKDVSLGARVALILMTLVGLMLVACKSDVNDVPSLDTDGAQRAEPTAWRLIGVTRRRRPPTRNVPGIKTFVHT
jgi:hypothetical protein